MMSAANEDDVVVIDDDDDDDDQEVQCIEINGDVTYQTASKNERCPWRKKDRVPTAGGYTKPSHSYPMIITQALALCKKMQATAIEICELISQKYPYYKFHPKPSQWRGSIFHCLTNRKKFFVVVGMNDNNEYIWSFNPAFEKYMLNKWVPKYLRQQKSTPSLPIPTAIVSNPLTENSTASTSSIEPLSPVIVSCETLRPETDVNQVFVDEGNPELITGDPNQSTNDEVVREEPVTGGPEYALADPNEISDPSWESGLPDPTNPNNLRTNQSTTEVETDSSQPHRLPLPTPGVGKKNGAKDFTLDNLHFKHIITNEEISYRLHFNKEHPLIEKFRLHCTVCDVHLGTAPAAFKANVRFHSNLGVITCLACYEHTLVMEVGKENYCLWCMLPASDSYSCSRCITKFCKACVKRNFGSSWVVGSKAGWECFLCDTKQIWPHRAIAYFLFRHYGDLKRKIMLTAKGNISEMGNVGFWIKDQSTCCNQPLAGESITYPSSNSSDSTSNLPMLHRKIVLPSLVTNPLRIPNTNSSLQTSNSVPVSQNSILINEQFPNIYVQSTVGAPTVTLNTGTQYIHNIYPDKNYLVVQAPVSDDEVTASRNVASNMYLTPQPSQSQPPVQNTTYRPLVPKPAEALPLTQALVNNSFVSTNSLLRAKTLPDTYNDKSLKSSSITDKIVHNNTTARELNYTPDTPEISIIHKNDHSSDIHIVPDNEFLPRTSHKNGSTTLNGGIKSSSYVPPELPKNVVVNKITPLSLRERIENKPMPKSKKASLLKSLLLAEEVDEPMSLEVQETYNSNALIISGNEALSNVEQIQVDDTPETPVAHLNSTQHVEEPILKSIIESAIERLASLQKNQPSSSSANNVNVTYNTNMEVNKNNFQFVNLSCENNISESFASGHNDTNSCIPKIKIKTLQELQEAPVISSSEDVVSELSAAKLQTTNDLNTEDVEKPKDIDIADLKQGIIEASRTLISTQKKFKELAKAISSTLSYKPDQAVEFITKFQNILKSCRKKLDGIDKKVCNKYENVIPNYDLDSILESIKNVGDSKVKKNNNLTPHEIILSPWHHSLKREENDPPYEINRDFVETNPLDTKLILGTPEITKEDIQQFIDRTCESPSVNSIATEIKSEPAYTATLTKKSVKRNALNNCYKKREIWSSPKSRRKKKLQAQLQKNGAVVNKRGRPKTAGQSGSQGSGAVKNLQTSLKPISLPLRSSSRKHQSTAAHSSHHPAIVAYLPYNYVIKPCSVVVHRLDSRVVELLQKRIK